MGEFVYGPPNLARAMIGVELSGLVIDLFYDNKSSLSWFSSSWEWVEEVSIQNQKMLINIMIEEALRLQTGYAIQRLEYIEEYLNLRTDPAAVYLLCQLANAWTKVGYISRAKKNSRLCKRNRSD